MPLVALPRGPRASAFNLARFAWRPLDVLLRWHARYGDISTVRFAGFDAGVHVADPQASN